MHGWETRMLLKHYLERCVSKTELSRRFGPLHHCHIVNIRGNSYRMREHRNLVRPESEQTG